MSVLLQAVDLTIGYRKGRRHPRIVSRDLDLMVCSGEIICLIGPNGSGKSTLLRTMTGLQPPLAGDVFLKGRRIRSLLPAERAKMVSVVLTHQVNVGQLSVYDLCALGRSPYTNWVGSLATHDHACIVHALERMGIAHAAHRRLHELSDGERQKVMIARALTQEPALMVLDEPTAFLDMPYRVEVMHILRSLAREEGRGILLSTHDLDLAIRTADQLWVLNREGQFFSGAPEDMVLSGVISEVFAVGDISYDTRSGQFTLPSSRKGRVRVTGTDGVVRFWTERAMERIGFVPDGALDPVVQVRIGQGGDGVVWEVTTGSGTCCFGNLTQCTAWLQETTLAESECL